ncbi:MAG: SNF2 helicase associated domain-containing protein [Clostridium sp.]|jgi:SNF2 family DNA or RNA helicase|uniref:DEAD/DEAH box helicase n=1 Tax=Butyribacter sp. TaxID=2822465 RepID=UPI003A240B48
MYKITREAIRRLATTETVYYRGMRYYAAHAVSDVTWNEATKQYHAFVQGSNIYGVTIGFGEDEQITHSCNCPAHAKYPGACKHVVAALLFIADYQQRADALENLGWEDQTAYKIIEYFRKREYRKLTPQYFHLALQVTVNEPLKSRQSKAFVGLYAGSSKMYKVSNTKKFIQDYYNHKEIRLGKEFRYIPEECQFEPTSAAVLAYLTEIYEIQETLGKTYYSNLFNRQELVVSQNMLCKLLRLAEGLHCDIILRDKKMENMEIMCSNPKLSMELQMEDEVLSLHDMGQEPIISICEDGSILCYQGCIYLPDMEFLANLRPFFTTLFGKKQSELEFRGENMGSFIEKVLPVIKKTMNIQVPEKIKDHYIVEQLQPKLYFDIDRSRQRPVLVARMIFAYGEHEVNPLQDEQKGSYILVRDREEEEQLLRLMYDKHFSVRREQFVLTKEDEIFQLMTEGIQDLCRQFEVFYSKEYKANSIKKVGMLSAGIRLNTDINLLEMDVDYGHIPKEELRDFFRSIKLKKKYYRLKSGAFVNLMTEDKQIDELRDLLSIGEVTEDNKIAFSQTAVMEVDELLPHTQRITRDAGYKQLLEDLKNPDKTNWELPNGMEDILRPYQITGYRWLCSLAHYGMGGILADDMGLGKTLQTITYVLANPGTRTLIVCPTSLAYNWQDEFSKFAPQIATQIISGTPQERADLMQQSTDVPVWITTYPLIRKDVDLYKAQIFDACFIDEAQFIKNPTSLGAKAVKAVQAKHRFALTGTPIENTLSELWSIFDFVMPGFFGRYRQFEECYEKPILRDHDSVQMQKLRRKIRPFVLRRMKKEVLTELPDKIETRRMAEMGAKQRKIYESYLARIQMELAGDEENTPGGNRMQVLAALTRLRQICCHPATFASNYHGGSGKLDLLMEQLPDILEGGHSVIVFSQFTSMLSIIAHELKQRNIPFFYLAGSTSAQERKREVKEFNRGEVKVFLISLKAGGTGLNLTGADTVIHFDPWWNPAVEDQATDRAYRIGQKKKVQVIKYVMKDSIEEKIYELQKRKKQLSDQLIQAGESFVTQLTMEEIKELFL